MRHETPQSEYTRVLDRYEISRELGRGGMAVVYLARQTDLDRWVALKELHPEGRDPSLLRRFLRESRLAGSLTHPNIVTVLDFFEEGGTGYIAMEYVPRGSLRPHVGALTLAQVAGVLEGVLAALVCAERHGIVHRDLKPENVMVTWDGRVKLADFGIAKATGAGSLLTAAGTTLGTPHYMAPEQAMALEIGPWTDLYSVGCMAYELVTGRLPFGESDSPMAILLRHINEIPAPAASISPSLDPRLSDWIDWLLAKDAAARPSSATEAWESFEEIALAVEGPRWRRAAALPATGGGEVPGPYTPPSTQAVPDEPVFATFHPRLPAPPPEDPDAAMAVGSDALPAEPAEPADVPAPPPVEPPAPSAPPPDLAAPTVPAPPAEVPASSAPPLDPPPPIALTVPSLDSAEPRPAAPARWRSRAVIAGVVALLVAGALAAALIVGGGDPPAGDAVVAPPVPLRAGALRVELPPGWSALSLPVQLPGLRLTDGAAAAPGGRDSRGVALVGFAPRDAHNATLLPSKLLDALDVAPERTVVRLGALPAYRYEGLRPSGLDRSLTVYAAPTSAGVATVACLEPIPAADCRRIAESLTVSGARGFAVGLDKRLAAAADRGLARLASDLRRDGGALREARTQRGQGSRAKRVAADYRAATVAIADLSVGPADEAVVARLKRALAASGTAYGELGSAAVTGDRSRYARAAKAARTAERELSAAIKASGYDALIDADPRPLTIPGLRHPPKAKADPDPRPVDPDPDPDPIDPEPDYPKPGPGPRPPCGSLKCGEG